MTICSLQSTVGYELALRKLSASGTQGVFQRWLRGPLRGVAEIYIPYRLYKVALKDRGSSTSRYYAVDAATGALDPYEFAVPPAHGAWVKVETRNFHPIRLEESETREITIARVRRLLFSRGFFRVANPQITAELIEPEFHMPYWVGFYGSEQKVNIIVLDAIRQSVEGSKARHLVGAWLRGFSAEADVMFRLGSSLPR